MPLTLHVNIGPSLAVTTHLLVGLLHSSKAQSTNVSQHHAYIAVPTYKTTYLHMRVRVLVTVRQARVCTNGEGALGPRFRIGQKLRKHRA